LKILQSVIDDVACILLEPVLGGAGCIPPDIDYLRGLHEFAHKNNILLIFDEIVTGFRLSIGGAIQKYGLDPDIFTLGKIAGGGLPIGVVCGRKDIMALADPTSKIENHLRCNIGGGTFSCNPVTMKAGLATIKFLDENKQAIYTKIDRLGAKARLGLAKIFKESNICAHVTGEGSLFLTHFLNEKVKAVKNATDAALSNKTSLYRYHFGLIAHHKIFFLPTKMGAISFAHTDADIDRLLVATRAIVDSGLFSV
jgi:glutamate-1-semialdehyde 2,1-aminomutase